MPTIRVQLGGVHGEHLHGGFAITGEREQTLREPAVAVIAFEDELIAHIPGPPVRPPIVRIGRGDAIRHGTGVLQVRQLRGTVTH